MQSTVKKKKTYNKANTMPGITARILEYKKPEVMLSLYNSMVRPRLEYAVQFWSSNYRKDIELLKNSATRYEDDSTLEGPAI